MSLYDSIRGAYREYSGQVVDQGGNGTRWVECCTQIRGQSLGMLQKGVGTCIFGIIPLVYIHYVYFVCYVRLYMIRYYIYDYILYTHTMYTYHQSSTISTIYYIHIQQAEKTVPSPQGGPCNTKPYVDLHTCIDM